jgi:hypothetical protein
MVLLADQQSFCASYLAQALTAAGFRVLGPFGSREELDAQLASLRETPAAAIVALDWLQGSHDTFVAQLAPLGIPSLLIENHPWRDFAGVQASFTWPYGAFQVMEAVQELMLQTMAQSSRGAAAG